MVKVLFVCTGNICRSPTAEGVFRFLVREAGLSGLIATDSAGTDGYHAGEPPDRRSMMTAKGHGIDISDLRARQVDPQDFHDFDYLMAMDSGHERRLQRLAPPDSEHKIHLLLNFAADCPFNDVPDPYYGGSRGFEDVYDMIADACQGLLSHIRRQLDGE